MDGDLGGTETVLLKAGILHLAGGIVPLEFFSLVLFNVHFSGNAARMQKSQEVQLRLQVLQFAMQAMQQDPTVAYKVDLVEMLNSIIEDYSISLRGFRSDQEASRLAKQAEEARAAQQQQIMQNIAQQQAETQEILAKTAKIRSEI